MKKRNGLWLLSCALAFMGCAHVVPPTDLISKAEITVKEVEKPDSMQTAPLDVKKAREHLDQAKNAMTQKNYTLARRLAEQSLADAQLAQAKTNVEKTKQTSDEAAKGIDTLREETNRKVTQ